MSAQLSWRHAKQAGVRGIIFWVRFQQLCHAETQKRSYTGKSYIVVLLVDYHRSVRTALVRMQTQVVYGLALEPEEKQEVPR